MSRAFPVLLRAPLFGALAVTVALVTGVACDRHEVTNAMASNSEPEGHHAPGQAPAPAAPGAAGSGAPQGSSAQPGAMGGPSGAAVGMAGTGGESGVVHVAMKTAGASGEGAHEESATAILDKLHQTDLKEIEMGKLAEKRSTSKEVKSYAATLVRDHTAADKRIMAFAKTEHLDIAAAQHPHDMGAMKPETGADFDKAFASEMLHDHQRDVAEVTEVRDSTKDTKLKRLLSSLLPVLEEHEKAAQKIVDHIGSQQK